ncbi:MAG: helix-turn-helix transcriptional regulator [Pseudomonadota bacterium]
MEGGPSRSEVEDDQLENGELQTRNARKPNPIDTHVGSRVRFRRMLLGMSQEKLGEQLGLTFQQVQKYEKGVNRIGASRLFELANVLGVNVQFFYDEAPELGENKGAAGLAEEPANDYVGGFLKSREGIELNRAFAKISDPKVRRSVVDLVRSLADEDEFQDQQHSRQQSA